MGLRVSERVEGYVSEYIEQIVLEIIQRSSLVGM